MNTVATVISVSGLAWVQDASGERRLLTPGDQVQPGESLVTTASTHVVLDFGGQRPLAFVGAEPGTEAAAQSADIPVILLPAPAAGEEPETHYEDGGRNAPVPDGHGFVQLVKIAEIVEADGITPLTVSAIRELLDPLAMDWPDPEDELDEERYNRGGDDGMVFVDNVAPGVSVELQGSGDDGIYNEAEIGPDGTVMAEITLQPGTEKGDLLVVTDKDGNVLLERPVTEDDLISGVLVEVPVTPGDRDVSVNASITDPVGNSGQDLDSKPVDWQVKVDIPSDQDATTPNGMNTDQVVFERGLASGSDPSLADTQVHSQFTLTAQDGLADADAVTLAYTDANGQPATLTLSKTQVEELGTAAQTIITSYGELVLNGYSQAADGTLTLAYDYTLTRAPGESGTDTNDTFSITATDRDGDSHSDDLSIKIVDDAPQAHDDRNSITEDAVSVSGNVIAQGAAGDVADTQGADGAEVSGIISDNVPSNDASTQANGDRVIEGQYGTLTIQADGRYSYVLDNSHLEVQALIVGETLDEVFTYTLTDGDDDSAEAALTITISGADDGVTVDVPNDTTATTPDADNTDQVVFERGLASGSDPSLADTQVHSQFTLTAQDGLADADAVTLAYTDANGQPATLTLSKTQVEELGTAAQTIITSYGELVLNGYSQAADGTLTLAYDYTLTRAPGESGTDTNDTFSITATDRDGDSHSDDLSIKIVDDAPQAHDDRNSITEDAVSVSGNVIAQGAAGDVADTQGADGAEVSGIISDNVPSNDASTQANGDRVIEGQYGTLTIQADGRYSYVLDNSHLEVQALIVGETLDEVFTYTLTDGDDDSAEAALTITISGADDGVTVDVPNDTTATTPDADNTDQVVFERGLASGSDPSLADTQVHSQFTLTAQDGLADADAVTLAYTDANGQPATLTLSKTQVEELGTAAQTIITSYGELVLNGYSQAADGTLTLAYDYTLTRAPGESGTDTNDTFSITATDRDGDSHSDDLSIKIVDDAPQAHDDRNSITEDAVPVSGNVIAQGAAGDVADTQGADGAEVSGIISDNVPSNDTSTLANGDRVIEGQYGTLTIQADGRYSYVLDNSHLEVQALIVGETLDEVFTYTLTDGDDDSAEAALTITISGADDGVTVDVPNDTTATTPDADNTDQVVFERGLASGSDPSLADTQVHSQFTLTAQDGLADADAVTLAYTDANGQPATLTLSKTQVEELGTAAQTIITSYGELVLNGYSQAADGTLTLAYDYTLTRAPGESGTDTNDTFSITATDRDGDSHSDDLSIKIVDDAPQAHDDRNSVTEDDAINTVIGNVIAQGAAGDVADTQGADGAEVSGIISDNVPSNDASTLANGDRVIEGQYGTLTIQADGRYSYVLDNSHLEVQALIVGETLDEVFTYTLTDGDDDSAEAALTITISGADDGVTVDVPNDTTATTPDADNTDQVVFERGLASGSDPSLADTQVHSQFTLTAQDGLADADAVTLAYTDANGQPATLTLSKTQVEELGTAAQTIITSYGELVLNGYSQAADGTLTLAYDYTLTRAPGESGTDTNDTFSITATDRDGDSHSDDLSIKIVDDAPQAHDDRNSITEDAVSVSGNVIAQGAAGDVADTQGADGAEVSGIISDNVPSNDASTQANGDRVIEGQYGTLTIQADGRYSYVLDNSHLEVQALIVGETLDEVFTYTLTDGDDDSAEAALTITISGADDGVTVDVPNDTTATTPDADNTDQVVFERGLASGSDPSLADTQVHSQFTLTAQDGLADADAVTLAYTDANGQPATLTLSKTQVEELGTAAQTIITSYGELVLNGYSQAADGTLTLAYDYTLTRAPGESGTDTNDTFSITATDRDGDSHSDDLSIKIVDDAPQADDDRNSITEGAILTVDANNGVLSNDTAGADGWAGGGSAVVGVVVGAGVAAANTEVGQPLVGKYGTLTLNADGSYEYASTANAITGDKADEFTYTVRDADGDETTATLIIDVDDVTGSPVDSTGSVDEAGLSAGTNAESDVEKVIEGDLTLQSGWSIKQLQSGTASFGTWAVKTDGTFDYTLTSSTTDGEGTETDSFTYTAEDQFGNTVTNTVTITIVDDEPVAVADRGVVTEGAALEVDAASGVLSNDTAGADGWAGGGSAVVGVVVGAGVAAANTEVGQPLVGKYGTLTLNADGSYTYQAAANSITADVEDVFTYTVKDSDGDLKEATLIINVADVTGTSVNASGKVNEAGLPAGTEATSDSESITDGSLNLQPGWTVVGEQSGTASFGTWAVKTDGTFDYTLTSSTTDGEDTETDSFTYTAEDQFGNTVTNTVTITIVDDEPVITASGVVPGSITVDETALGVSAADPDFIDGVFNINHGADGAATTDDRAYGLKVTAGAESGVTDMATGADIYLFMNGDDVVGRVGNSSTGSIAFRIEIDAKTGAVTLTQNRPLQHPDRVDHDDALSLLDEAVRLVATVTDGDGDQDSASVNVGGRFTFRDDGPQVNGEPPAARVDEKYLDSGSEAGKGSTGVTANLPIDIGQDGMGSLVFSDDQSGLEAYLAAMGNTGITLTVNGNTLTAARGDMDVFVVTLDETTGRYTFELKGALTHPDASAGELDLNFAYRVKDADGDEASGSFTVNVIDDSPKAVLSIETDEDTAYGPFTTSADAGKDNVSIQLADGNEATAVTSLPDGTSIPSGTSGYDVGHGVVIVDAWGQLTYYPDGDYSNDGGSDGFQITITNDSGGSTVTNVTVNVKPVADAPELTVDSTEIGTREDTPVALGLNAPIVTDANDQNGSASAGDLPELLGVITLSGLPQGAVLAFGGQTHTVDASGSLTLTLSDGSHIQGAGLNGDLSMSKADFESMTVTPPSHAHENFTVNVSVTSYEVDSAGRPLTGVPGASSNTRVDVKVEAVTDDAELVFDTAQGIGIDGIENVVYTDNTEATVTLQEDGHFNLKDILSASFEDLDGSEMRSITITNTTGESILVNNTTVASGRSIRIDDNAGAGGQTGGIDSFPDIKIGADSDFSGDLDGIRVTINAQDKDGDGYLGHPYSADGVAEANTGNNSVDLNLRVKPVAGDVTTDDVTTTEDTAVNFLENLKVTDTGTGSEVINSVAFEIPVGWSLSAPVNNGGWGVSGTGTAGSPYIITFDDSLTEGQRETVLDGFTIKPPAHSSADMEIALSITTTDTQTVNGTEVSDTRTVNDSVKVTVTPKGEVEKGASDDTDPDDLIMTGDHEYTRVGEEDTWFDLGIDGSFDLGSDWSNEDADGSEQTFALLTPQLDRGDGSQTDANGCQLKYFDGTDWITQTYGGDAIAVPAAFLSTLEFLAPANFAGKFEIKVQALTRDTDPDDGTVDEQISGESILSNILIKPKADTPTSTVTARVNGNEDDTMSLSIRPSSSDPSETFNVTIGAIPDGAELVYDGITLSKEATGLPGGMSISVDADGSWTVVIKKFDPAKGDQMSITPPLHSNEPFELEVGTVSIDTLEIPGDLDSPYVSESGSFDLTIKVTPKGVADSADVELEAKRTFAEADVDTDGGVMLSQLLAKTELIDNDGSETLTFKIGGLPEGFGVEGGTYLGNNQWSFAKADLDKIKITTPANVNGTASFTLYSVTTENDGNSLTEARTVDFTVTPSPEALLNQNARVDEDVSTRLDFGIRHQNGDIDETITGVWIKAADVDSNPHFILTYGPNGAPLAGGEAGVELADGWYKLSGDAIHNIHVQGAENSDADASFTVRYEVTDPAMDSSVQDVTQVSGDTQYTVAINPVTDQPTLNVTSDTAISLDAPGSATVNIAVGNENGDYDGSEVLTRILLSQVPQGVVVNGAEYIGDGQWLFITDKPFTGVLNESLTLGFHHGADNLTDHAISITVTTEDRGNGEPLTASTRVEVSTRFSGGEGEDPALILNWSDNHFEPTEDTAFTLDQAIRGSIESDVTDNGFNITLSGLPAGTQVSGMTATVINSQVVWTASGIGGDAELQALLQSIRVTPPADWNRTDGSFDFNATLTTFVPSGQRNDADLNLSQQVIPVSDAADVAISVPTVAEGNDLTFTFNIGNSADAPDWTLIDGKLYLQLNDSGLDGGGNLLDAGGNLLATETVSGVTGLSDGSYFVVSGVAPSSPVNVIYRPSSSVASGSVTVEGWVQGQENGAANSVLGQGRQTAEITPVNSGYDFTVTDGQGAENPEQQVAADKSNLVRVNVSDNGLVDGDGSESVGTILLGNLPEGFLVYVGTDANNATLASLSNNAGGTAGRNTWLLGEDSIPSYIAIMPPQHWSGTLSDLKLQVLSGETGLTQRLDEHRFDLMVDAAADGLSMKPTPSFGDEGSIIRLNLNHELMDPASAGAGDTSTETLTLAFKGLGEHAAFYLGDNLISGSGQVTYDETSGIYTIGGLTSAEAETLGFKQAGSDISNLQVRGQTVESANGDTSDWTGWEDIDTTITEQFGTTEGDSLMWTGNLLDGRGGEDTVQLRFGESLSGTELGSQLDNLEVIDLSGNGSNSITSLTADDVLNITDDRNTLRIDGDANDHLSLHDLVSEGAWQEDTSSTSTTHTSYTAVVGGNTVMLEVANSILID